MGFLDRLKRFFAGGPGGSSSGAGDPNGIWFYFRCDHCGSVVKVRAHRYNDLNREDGPAALVLRKDVMDDKCFRLIQAELWLDESYTPVETNIQGGKLITQEEYEAAQARH
jgi:hypothetical protein